MANDRAPRVCVLAPTPLLTVTVEPANGPDGPPEVHVHAGGQGLWVARMAASLGADVVLCGPFGGEIGVIAAHLAVNERLAVRATGYAGGNGVYVHDRRGGERAEVAATPPGPLDRHELDDLYGTALVEAMDSDVTVITGSDPAEILPAWFVEHLARDLRAAGRTVVADLSGEAAKTFVAAGGTVLKISHEELLDAGLAESDAPSDLRAAAERLIDGPLGAVVVSRAGRPSLVVAQDDVVEVVPPRVSVVDHRGAGDSMTAGIAVGLGRGLDLEEAVRLGAAAGALNVTRHGLGTAQADQIERFARQVRVRRPGPDPTPSPTA